MAVFFLLLTKSGFAQPGDPERDPGAAAATLPATRAGNQLMWVLKVVNGQEVGDLAEHFSDRFIATKGDDTREVLQGLRDEVFDGRKVIVNKVLEGDREHDISVEITAQGSWRYLHVFLMLDETSGKIAGLRFAPAGGVGRNVGNWKQFDAALNRMPAGISFGAYELVPRNPNEPTSPLILKVVAEVEADKRLAVASTAYLYTLGALGEEVARGEAAWDEKLALREDRKSLPPGEMRGMEGEHTLAEFARRVMDESDNTAADHLLHRVGREKVEAYMSTINLSPERSRPFLSSRECFALKLHKEPERLAQYAAASPEARSAMLAEATRVMPEAADAEAWTEPKEVERVGWFASASECCRLMLDLHRLTQKEGMEPLEKALGANRGLRVSREVWPRVWYKGGSEPGVLNMTWFMERDDGRLYAMSVGWNNGKAPLQEARLLDMANAAFRLLAEDGRPRAKQPPPERARPDPEGAN